MSDVDRRDLVLADFSKATFIAAREAQDKSLPMPRFILPSLQINIRGGRLAEPESNGRPYRKIPIGALDDAAWE